MTGEQTAEDVLLEGEEDDERLDHEQAEHAMRQHGGARAEAPKLLTDIERVIDGIHNPDEVDESVEQLEAILYGGSGDGLDDGFIWASSSSSPPKQLSAKSLSALQQKNEIDMENRWSNLPSHHTNNNYPSVRSNDTDVSDWTHDMDGSSDERTISAGITQKNPGQHHKNYDRQGSTELVLHPGAKAGAGRDAGHARAHRQYKKKRPSAVGDANYKYQISFYIQMQLCNSSTLADWIRHRNASSSREVDARQRQARARVALEIFRQIVDGLAHVQ